MIDFNKMYERKTATPEPRCIEVMREWKSKPKIVALPKERPCPMNRIIDLDELLSRLEEE